MKRTSRGAFAKLTTMARGRPRITAEPPLRVTIDDERAGGHRRPSADQLPAHAPRGPADAVRPLHPGGRGAPGGGGGQRRHGRVPRALHGSFRCRPALPAVQAGRSVGLRVAHVPERVRQPRGAGHLRQEDGAERDGHLRRLGIICRARLLRAPVPRHEGDPEDRPVAPVLVQFATACGNTLARAHARSGDPVAIDAYMGKSDEFTKAMRKFARRYARQNERDHAQLVAAIRRGKVEGVPE